MPNIYPSRANSPILNKKNVDAQVYTLLPPTAGWISNAPLAAQTENSAFMLENFWPSASSIEPRGGSVHRCSIGGAVTSLFEYDNQPLNTFFAADLNNIYEFSSNSNSGEQLTAVVTGQTNGEYSTVEMKTDGGDYLIAVNGHDPMQIYDGENWQQVTNTSTPFVINNIDSEDIIHCWTYRNRVFLVEKGTLNAWYLDVNSVAGDAHKLPLGGIFTKGGSLLLGTRWSSDSGNALDDRCVFITNTGELAIYAGGDPADANNWNLQGVYDIGEPLGRNAAMNIGGDIAIATKIGLVPLAAAVQKDPVQLKLHSASRGIDPEWRFETILSGNLKNWKVAKWNSRNMGIVAPPPNSKYENGYCWVVNLETGAWSRFTGWRIAALAVLGDNLYYGDTDGKIFAADVGGKDNEAPFECKVCFGFNHLGTPGATKIAHMVRATWRYRVASAKATYSIATDYEPKFMTMPSSSEQIYGSDDATWGNSQWSSQSWGAGFAKDKITKEWKNLAAQGTTLGVQIQLVSAQNAKLDCELITIELVYSTGGTIV